MSFNNRIYGCAIIKSINSNYNADFSHQPRTLPNGVVYATDKALKYAIKNYLKDLYSEENIFYFKRFNENFQPLRLEDAYNNMFTGREKPSKTVVAKDLISCLDIRCFGATFAMKAKGGDNIAISIHGPVQINHGVNIWQENNIFSEQIMSPFADKEGADASTLGRQSKLQEGHYLHHFSINPKNLASVVTLAGEGAKNLESPDIDKLKDALRKSVTYYDSAAKAGTDNEFLLWVKLKDASKTVLPNFTGLVSLDKDDKGMVQIDLSNVKKVLADCKDEIEAVEIYYLPESCKIKNEPIENTKFFNLTTGKEIQKEKAES
jgi:CRISPR-associated protein Csh2